MERIQSLSCYINFNYIKIIINKHKNRIMNSLIRKRITLKSNISINRIIIIFFYKIIKKSSKDFAMNIFKKYEPKNRNENIIICPSKNCEYIGPSINFLIKIN